MTDFDIKKGCYKNIEGDGLKNIMQAVFGNATVEGDMVVSSFGVMARIEAKPVSKTVLDVKVTNVDAKEFKDEDVLNSKRKLNEFLEKATGFDAKARMKRAQQKAKEGKL